MKKLNYFNFNNKVNHKNKVFIYIFMILLSISLLVFWQNYRYNTLFINFKYNFTNYNYDKANNLLLTKDPYNPFKVFKLKSDLIVFFDSELLKLSNQIKDNSTVDENILLELNEIKRYDVISADKLYNIAESSKLLKDSTINYNNGIKCFSENNYTDAISYFSKVSSLDLNYNSSLQYMNKSRKNIKENVFKYCDELVNNDYYSKALSIIDENNLLIKNDIDVKNKILEIKNKQQEYFDKNSEVVEASSFALIRDITPNNINTLNIQSDTQYLINVDINNQKTYIYKGKEDNWSLVKTFPCSTGIHGEETPKGSFTTKEKGDWFFSDK